MNLFHFPTNTLKNRFLIFFFLSSCAFISFGEFRSDLPEPKNEAEEEESIAKEEWIVLLLSSPPRSGRRGRLDMIGWEKGFSPFSSIFCSSLSLLRWRILYAIPHPIPSPTVFSPSFFGRAADIYCIHSCFSPWGGGDKKVFSQKGNWPFCETKKTFLCLPGSTSSSPEKKEIKKTKSGGWGAGEKCFLPFPMFFVA